MISILPADAHEAEQLVDAIVPLVAIQMVARTELLGAELAPAIEGDYIKAFVPPTSRDFVRAGEVHRALGLVSGEAFELAAWGLAGAERIVGRRLDAETRRCR